MRRKLQHTLATCGESCIPPLGARAAARWPPDHGNDGDPAILKSPNDARAYRLVTLPNRLRALLVSDPATERSAAALDVPIPVELYDESRTSLQAGLAVEASRGARGAAASLRPEARLDDVAAALLLERYFRKDRGPALPVKPIRGSLPRSEGGRR